MVDYRRYSYFNSPLNNQEILATRKRAAELIKRDPDNPLSILDPDIDQVWASMNEWSSGVNSYFDYFFMGEDMRVYMAETADDPEYGDMPIAGVGFNIQQQKAPVFGYWSETYDAVMRGSRIIEGQFVIYTKGADYMKKALSRAAHNRQNNHAALQDRYPVPESWREDDQNIQEYWHQTLDPAAKLTQGNIFSIHPPFDLVFIFGKQDTSVENMDVSANYAEDTPLYVDTNQRLIEESGKFSSRMAVVGCEITGMSTTIQPNSFVMEQYSFFARDLVIPRPPVKVSDRTIEISKTRSGSGGINNIAR